MSTLKLIADEAGVSIKTVSNILNGRTRALWPAAAERAERIRKIAQRLNYVPHASARSMRSGRFGTAALVTGGQFLPFTLVSELHRGLAPHGTQLAFEEISKQDIQDPNFAPRFLREQCVDGIFVYQLIDIPERIRQRIVSMGFSTVWLNSKGAFDSVYADEEAIAFSVTQRLIRAGHRRIGFLLTNAAYDEAVAGNSWHFSIHDRLQGYQRAMAEAGLAPRLHIARRKLDDPAVSLDYVADILRAPERSTALIAFDLTNTYEAITAASRLGLRIPDDLLIASFVADDTPAARHEMLPIVTARMPWAAVATSAVAMLQHKLANPADAMPSQRVPYGELTIGPALAGIPALASPATMSGT